MKFAKESAGESAKGSQASEATGAQARRASAPRWMTWIAGSALALGLLVALAAVATV